MTRLNAQPLVTIETVTVGDAGNAPDTTTNWVDGTGGYGAVADVFAIGKYEVTISQYTTFLNSVAKSDPYGLYNTEMANDLNIAGISRSGSDGSYNYSVISPSGSTPPGASSPGNRPIAYVSWFDAARFANWMHNGATNGASTETGAYTLNGATNGIIAKNAGATWYLPSEDQWYKAAYYKGGGTNAGYWLYPTQSDSAPGNTIGGATNQANYHKRIDLYSRVYSVTQSSSYSSSQNYLTDVGAYSNSASAYGTFDQGGNVWEWNDAVRGETTRGLRGGSWQWFEIYFLTDGLSSFGREGGDPSGAYGGLVGFRLATVPEPSTVSGDWTYTLNPSNEATITAYSGAGGAVTIPASIDGYVVKVVGAGSPPIFGQGNTTVTSVTIGNGVTSIGNGAFSDCIRLTSVIIPNSVTSIGYSAFVRCTGLTSVIIPNSVTSIGSSAFYGCTGLTSVTIGNGVTSIGNGAFYQCTGLTSVIIGNGVTSIAYDAFSTCIRLTSVIIPDSVTSIGDSAFSGCTDLTSVIIGNGVTSIGSSAFYGCTGLTSVSFTGNAPSDPGNAFLNISPVGAVYYLEGTTGWGGTYSGWPTQMLSCAQFISVAGAQQFISGRASVTNNPATYSLFTQNQYDSHHSNGVTQGVADVTNNPAAYSLFTQNQYDTHHSNGVTQGIGIVLSNTAAYGLFTQTQYDENRTNGIAEGRADVTNNPASYSLFTQAQYDANRSDGIQWALDSLPAVDFAAPSAAEVRAGLGATNTNITTVAVESLPDGWEFDESTQEIVGRLAGTETVNAMLWASLTSGGTVPVSLNFTPIEPDVAFISMPLSKKIKAGKATKLSLAVYNHSSSPKTVTIEFTSSDEDLLPAPGARSVTVPGRNSSSGTPGRAIVVVVLTAGESGGEAEITASGGGVSSAPCAVKIKAGKKR